MKTAGKHNSSINRDRAEKRRAGASNSLKKAKRAAHREDRHSVRQNLGDHYGMWEDWV